MVLSPSHALSSRTPSATGRRSARNGSVTPLAALPPGTPIRLVRGILFATDATPRLDEREEKAFAFEQIVDLARRDFDRAILFDEGHAMANAAGGKSERGARPPRSKDARACGFSTRRPMPASSMSPPPARPPCTTSPMPAPRLWVGEHFPFATRAEFVAAIEAGGVAAMEVLARDLKALGLYAARSLSYHGVEYDLVEHQLTDEQIRIYDAYAGRVRRHPQQSRRRAEGDQRHRRYRHAERQAKSAARSAFESAKQRFFNHLITAMKTPSLIAAVERDLTAGHAAVIQIVSTGEALMERRLAEIPTEEWGDVQVDITPREYVLDYLAHSFPTQLYEPFTDRRAISPRARCIATASPSSAAMPSRAAIG